MSEVILAKISQNHFKKASLEVNSEDLSRCIHDPICEKSILNRGNSKRKGPEIGSDLSHVRVLGLSCV